MCKCATYLLWIGLLVLLKLGYTLYDESLQFFSSKEGARKEDEEVKYRMYTQYMEVQNNYMKEAK